MKGRKRSRCESSNVRAPLLPGLGYQSYDIMCFALDPRHGPMEMWLLREGMDERDLDFNAQSLASTVQFAVPPRLFEHAAARVRQATKVYENTPANAEPARGEVYGAERGALIMRKWVARRTRQSHGRCRRRTRTRSRLSPSAQPARASGLASECAK